MKQIVAVAAMALALHVAPGARTQAPAGAQERVAAIKQNLQESQARLRNYEWVETTVISLKGEEKSRKQNRCYYGADGNVQKTPIGGEPQQAQAPQGGGGRRGGRLKQKVVENKKDEMQDYMERAGNLIKQYVPPSAERIQAAKGAGHVVPSASAGRARVEITDYLQPGDSLAFEVDAAANTLVAVSVATYLEKQDEPVTLDVRFATLPDGTNYSAQTTLDAKAKNISVVVQNSGYRPVAR